MKPRSRIPAWSVLSLLVGLGLGCGEESQPTGQQIDGPDCGGISGEINPWEATAEIRVGEVVVVNGRRDTLPIAGATIRCMGHLVDLQHPGETRTLVCNQEGIYGNTVESTSSKMAFDIFSASAAGFITEQYFGFGHLFCANDPASWSWTRTLTLSRE